MFRLFVVCLLLSGFTLALRAEDSRPPNIVLIVSDDQGYQDLGCFGSQEVKTPNLDRLAEEGVKGTSFYVSWPACTPSRGSILTGRYPQRNGLYDMIRNDVADYGKLIPPAEYAVSPERILGMDLREVMISEVLKKQGYQNAVYGKWDGGQLKRFLPMQRGFDDYYGLVNTGIDYFTHERYGVPSMFDQNELTTKDKGTYCTYLFQEKGLDFIDRNKDRPFFLYLPFNAPHGASNLDPKIRGAAQAPEKYKKMYPHLKDTLVKGKRYNKEAMVPSKSKRRLEYAASITCMDETIGKVLDRLDQYKLTENTLVIFFSDNGGSGGADNSPLRGRKGQMYEGGIRVPFLARYPGHIPAGTTTDEFLTTLELFPTFTKLAGAELPSGVTYDGFDMMPVLKGETSSLRTEMYWERRADQAVRIGNYKWVNYRGKTGLYDLSKDLSEKQDLSEEKPELLAKLKRKFATWKKTMEASEPRGPFRDY